MSAVRFRQSTHFHFLASTQRSHGSALTSSLIIIPQPEHDGNDEDNDDMDFVVLVLLEGIAGEGNGTCLLATDAPFLLG